MTDSEQLERQRELARAAGRPTTCTRCGTALTYGQLRHRNSFCSRRCSSDEYKRPILDRLLEKVDVDETTGCWLWRGRADDRGYGQIWNGRGTALVHRVSYEAHVGPIPNGLTIDHLCRTPRCVNPAHMEPVTHGENVLRGMAPSAENARKTHCKRGHPFNEENTYLTKSGRGCRTCKREQNRRWRRLRDPLEPVR